jgi:hypothetical protein
MQPNPATGFFDVRCDEVLTITVDASFTNYQASFPKRPSCTNWSFQSGPEDGKEVRQFVAAGPAGTHCTFDLLFDFQPDSNGEYPKGAQYTVTVSGSNGGSFCDPPVMPPPPQTRQYVFNLVD